MALKNIVTRIKALITADNKDLKKKMKESSKVAKKTGMDFKKMGKIIAGSVVVAGLVKFGKALLGVAKKMDLMGLKATVVFGTYQREVKAMADETAASMGLTKTEFVNTAAGIQDLLIPIGFMRKEATGMTKELMSLAGALSTWSGGMFSAEQVGRTFSKALLGEREELKSLGISITEAEVKTRLLEKGLSKATGSTLAQAKAQATLELITEKSTDAQVAFAGAGDSLIVKTATLKADFKQMGENLATILNPALNDTVGFLGKMVSNARQMSDEMTEVMTAENLSKWEKFAFKTLRHAERGLLGMIKPTREASIAMRAFILEQARLDKTTQEAIATMVDEGASLQDITDKFGRFYKGREADLIQFYLTQGALVNKGLSEQADAEALARAEALQDAKAGYWALEGALMAHNDAMKKLNVEGFTAQGVVMGKVNETLEAYHGNLGKLMEIYPLIIPVIQATTTAQQQQNDEMQIAIQDWNQRMTELGLGAEVMDAVAGSMVAASMRTGSSLKEVAAAAGSTAKQMISSAIARGIAAQVSSALENIPFPFGLIAAGLAGGAAAAIFNSVIPSFAEGGFVTGPTLAMVGDNPSGREAMIPSELWGTLGGTQEVVVTGNIRAGDLQLISDRYQNKLSRTGRR